MATIQWLLLASSPVDKWLAKLRYCSPNTPLRPGTQYPFDIHLNAISYHTISYHTKYHIIPSIIPVSYTHLTLPTNREV